MKACIYRKGAGVLDSRFRGNNCLKALSGIFCLLFVFSLSFTVLAEDNSEADPKARSESRRVISSPEAEKIKKEIADHKQILAQVKDKLEDCRRRCINDCSKLLPIPLPRRER